MPNIAIVGAGLVGSLLSCYFAKRNYSVKIYDRRSDFRQVDFIGGRSINLALSTRGFTALDKVDLVDPIKEIGIPMYGRLMHDVDGNTTYQPYGKEGQAIYSISRGELNKRLVQLADTYENTDFIFNKKCVKVDVRSSKIMFQDTNSKDIIEHEHDLIFGADGAFSKVRYSLQKTPMFNYSQMYLKHGYKEIEIPANEDGSHKLDKGCLHIWPRGHFMLIALPNLNGSFTCTLFAPFEGEDSFANIKTDEDVNNYFEKNFADAKELMPTLIEEWNDNPTSSLVTINCDPWTNGNIALIGDASHAVVPFYGQGMNAGFEDCRVLDDIIEDIGEDWKAVFEKYNEIRVPDAQAISKLALQNFIEMRDHVGDPKFLLRKKLEKKIAERFENDFMPLYSMVTFSNKRYSEAFSLGEKQGKLLDELMLSSNIESEWESEQIMERAKEWIESN